MARSSKVNLLKEWKKEKKILMWSRWFVVELFDHLLEGLELAIAMQFECFFVHLPYIWAFAQQLQVFL